MADYTVDNDLIQYLGLLVLAVIALITGLVIHSFIIGVNVNDWWKGRSVTSVDHIVTFLGISRMGTQCSQNLHLFLETFLLRSQSSQVILVILTTVYSFLSFSSTWLTSLLLIVFCLKISNFHSRLFLYLRRMILQRTGHFIVASGLLSAFNCFIHLWINIPLVIGDGTCNKTMNNKLMNCSDISVIFNFAIGSSMPLLFYFISSIVLFFSLYHHTVKMKNNNLSINLETYYSTMKFVFFTFIYNNIYLFALSAGVLYYYFYCLSPTWLQIILGFLPSLHSSYLIYRTAKLRHRISNVLQNIIHLFFKEK
ncbi:taste receptor type 2 member 39-like [Anomaloglossus baeobatrachus]|uniref:taste receptor type 2 member 39-like n=1 Tax=Anomaloglossus baeobatrachus TaxID=238106 RepID=UPI003F4FD8CF